VKLLDPSLTSSVAIPDVPRQGERLEIAGLGNEKVAESKICSVLRSNQLILRAKEVAMTGSPNSFRASTVN